MTAHEGGNVLPPGARLRRRGRRRPPPAGFPGGPRPTVLPEGPTTRFLGIDPGTFALGFGLLERSGSALAPVEFGVVRAPAQWSLDRRLLRIYEGLCELLDRLRPGAVAVEQIFAGRAPRGGLVLGQGRGVALLAVAQRKLPIFELPPAEIKKSVTGNGNASKAQVARMVVALTGLREAPRAPDASDALAAAWCLAQRAAWVMSGRSQDSGSRT